tara:strand:- start:406 stop:795 length:390 start_codon:yes stop_codon:yes gene_type:complete
MNIKALKNLIAEVRREQMNEGPMMADPSAHASMITAPASQAGNTTGQFDRSDHEEYEPSLTLEEKAQLYDALMQNTKILLENWKERDPQTMAGRYFHDLLHLVKSYDPHFFPASNSSFENQPFDPRQKY